MPKKRVLVSMAFKKIIVHIGLPKTGTTSFQHFLARNAENLIQAGFVPFQEDSEKYTKAKAVHLPHAILRANVIADVDKAAAMVRVSERMNWYADHSPGKTLIISSEPLAFARTCTETEALSQVLREYTDDIELVLVLRDKKDWWESYCENTRKNVQPDDQILPESQYNIESNSWLLDWQSMLDAYGAFFDPPTVLRYDSNDMLQSLSEVMGLPYAVLERIEKRYSQRKSIKMSKLESVVSFLSRARGW